MSSITLADLTRLLAESAGTHDQPALDDASLDTPLSDLGYDSLALLETAAVAARRYGAAVPDEDVTPARTPREFLLLLNSAVETV